MPPEKIGGVLSTLSKRVCVQHFFLIIPLAAMVGGLALPLMQLFQAGAFSSEDTLTVSMVLSVWTLSLPFYAGYMYMYRVFARPS